MSVPLPSSATRATATDRHRAPEPAAAFLLAGPAVLTLALVLHHPVLPPGPPGGRSAADVAAALARLGPTLGWVHGALLALLAAQALGLFRFSARLGWDRLPVAAGFLAYAAGALLLATPALLDGFVTPALAAACVRAAAQGTRECGPADVAALRLVAVMIQVFTKAGLLLLSAAAGAWALALLAGAGDFGASVGPALRRGVGVLGLACGVASAAALLLTGVWLRPSSLAALLAAQSVWTCAAAALMACGGGSAAAPGATLQADAA